MFVRHRVKDYATWKPMFNNHEGVRQMYGLNSFTLHRDADDHNMITINFRISNIAKAREFINSENLRETMRLAGVEGQPQIWLTEDLQG
jgi:hypothetical protein